MSSLLKTLPHCADVTRKYCSRYSGVLLVDGKYLYVKGYDRKIPVLYGIDYTTHDIPTYIFSIAENYQTCISFFQSLKLLNYPLQGIVCDDNVNIYQACRYVYPKAVTQLCLNHYKESIRSRLSVRREPTYVPFMRDVELLFKKKRSREEFSHIANRVYRKHKTDEQCISVLIDIQKRVDMLGAYRYQSSLPRTTNLIESFNSHLQGRLKTIKGFESFSHADDWLNAYFLYRRLKPFTDCEGRFRRLNGHPSLYYSMKNPDHLPTLLHLFR